MRIRVPFEVITFLGAVGRSGAIRDALAEVGYTDEEDAWAWQHLLSVAGYRMKAGPRGADVRGAHALVELDNVGGAFVKRVAAALRRSHPAPAAFVLAGVPLESGADAVFGVATVLDRLDALERFDGGAVSAKAARAALATLDARGVGAAERARLADLVARARAVAEPPAWPGEPLDNQRRAADLRALRAWFDDWSQTARAVIERRHQLDRLGLRRRAAGPDASPAVRGGGRRGHAH